MDIYEKNARLTAYLLGELPPGETAEVEKIVEENPEIAAECEKTRGMLAALEEALARETLLAPEIFTSREYQKMKYEENLKKMPAGRGKWLAALVGCVSLVLVIGGLAMLGGESWMGFHPLMSTDKVGGDRLAKSDLAGSVAEAPDCDEAYVDACDIAFDMPVDESLRAVETLEALVGDSLRESDVRKARETVSEDVLKIYVNVEEGSSSLPPAPKRSERDILGAGPGPGAPSGSADYYYGDGREVGSLMADAPGESAPIGYLQNSASLTTGLEREGKVKLDTSMTAPADEPAPMKIVVDPLGPGRPLAEKASEKVLADRLPELPPEPATPVQLPTFSYVTVPTPRDPHENLRNETYAKFVENEFKNPADIKDRFSTFGVDVDSASYTVMRQYVQDRRMLPPSDAVRVEEYINYFKYELAPPEDDGTPDTPPFAVKTDIFAHPWQPGLLMARITLKGREVTKENRPPLNLVFLIDVSGSMDSPNRLPLVQSSMIELLDQLTEKDRVAIVTYASGTAVRLDPTTVDAEGKKTIEQVIFSLKAGGSTAGGDGLRLAYSEAKKNYDEEAVNRIILCTDGDFNVGATDDATMESIVGAKTGIYLTVLGYGMGNYKDQRLKLLSDKGNGNYGYIDSREEARRLLVENLTGTIIRIAKDVKIQVDFNPAEVAAYRLVGYENRKLAAKDFDDDKKNAGEIGAGHSVTALYEIVPKGVAVPQTEPVSRYASDDSEAAAEETAVAENDDEKPSEMFFVKIRYKAPLGDVSDLLEFPIPAPPADVKSADSESFFAAGVALYGMILRKSEYIGTGTLDTVLELATPGVGENSDRKEFMELVRKAKTM